MSINKVILLGNLATDPTVREFDGGGKIASFRLATSERGYTTQSGQEVPERTEFHNIVIRRSGLAGVADKYLHKGDKVYIEGILRYRKYTDKDNVERWVTEINVEAIEMLSPQTRKKDDGEPVSESEEVKERGAELVEALDAEGVDDMPF